MPIRINLLAESQALEEARRKDPVKRAVWAGVILVSLVLCWSSSLQLKRMIAKGDLNRVEGQLATHTNEFAQVLQNQRLLAEVTHKLASLQQLATNRLLYGTLLNALQQATVDDVNLIRLRTEQGYAFTEEIKAKTNSNNRVVPAKPATVAEKITLTLEARDTGPNPGDQVNKFKRALADCPYFASILRKTNEVRLVSLSPPGAFEGRPAVQFSLECRFPERTR